MYGVMGGESASTMAYLKHIWGTPLFNLEMESYKAAEIQINNTKRIKNLEESVRLYPYSPELYYNLHLLYFENGNKVKAQENLQKAQQIDPSIQ